jgi:hypothetical protein
MKKFILFLSLLCMTAIIVACTNLTTTTTTNTTQSTASSTSVTTTSSQTISSDTTITTEEEVLNAYFVGVINVTIPLGTEFNKMSGITAFENDGTDITSTVTNSGLFNYNRAGTYTITYNVTGSSGVTITAQRMITVVENAFITTTSVSIVVVSGDIFDPLLNVTATDGDGADITDQITIEYPVGYSLNVAGDYELIYKVTGKNGYEATVSLIVTVVVPEPVKIMFGNMEAPTDGSEVLARTSTFNPMAGVYVRDYDGEDLVATLIIEGVVNIYEVGTYTLTYRAIGKNNVETVVQREIEIVDRYIEIAGNQFPININLINPIQLFENNTWMKGQITILTSIPSEFTTSANYPVVVIVDGNGRIVYVRDPFLSTTDINSPIRTFKADNPINTKDQSAGGSINYTSTTMFKGLTNASIPEGGFVLVFSYTEFADTNFSENHPARKFGLDMARRIGELVKIYGFEIPGYVQKSTSELLVFSGVADQYLVKNSVFDPLAGVTAAKGLESAVVTVEGSTVNLATNGFYYVLYKATLLNEEVFYARRVIVADTLTNARIEGLDRVVVLNTPTDLRNLVYAFEFSRELINYMMIIDDGGFDFTVEGVYTVNYSVTGQSGVTVTKQIIVTVTGLPIITVPKTEVTITQGTPFDAETGLVVTDFDGQLLEYTVSMYDPALIGVQTITISATGINGVNTLDITLTVLGPKPILTVDENFNHVVNQPLDAIDLASGVDHDASVIVPTYTIELEVEGVYQIVQLIDTSVAGQKYRIVFTLVGEYQTVTEQVVITIIDPSPVIKGAQSKAVYVGESFDPLTGVAAYSPFGDLLDSSLITITYEEGITAVNTSVAGVYTITYSVDFEVESTVYTDTVIIVINVVPTPTTNTIFINGIEIPAGKSIFYNQSPMTLSTATAGNFIWIYTNAALIPATIPLGAVGSSSMMIVGADGTIRMARLWYRLVTGGTEYMEEISAFRDKYAFTGAIAANSYFSVQASLGNLKGNILANGGTASTWTLLEGETLIVFGGNGATATSMAWWFRTACTPNIDALVQIYTTPIPE